MKDLYQQLELPGQERNVIAIRQAIEKCADRKLAAAARHILLNPARKAIYDRNWRVMRKIGQLRGNLRLTSTANWRDIDPAAFDSATATASSELAELRKRMGDKPDSDGSRRLQV